MEQGTPQAETGSTEEARPYAAAGLPGAPHEAHRILRKAGFDPDRLSILHLGRPPTLLGYRLPPWARRMIVGYALWLLLFLLDVVGVALPA